ncbi:MAG: hypothetical protein IJU60_03890 [Acholeplasmatales bacterium]|nr:hypothetical protein [Acholeplasmatales bacterium]
MKKTKIILSIICLALLFTTSCAISSTIFNIKNGTTEPTTTIVEPTTTSTEPGTSTSTTTGTVEPTTTTTVEPATTTTEPATTTTETPTTSTKTKLAAPRIDLEPTTIYGASGVSVVRWHSVSHATSYVIYVNEETIMVPGTDNATLTKIITGLDAGTYQIKIRAMATGYESSDFSNVETLTVRSQTTPTTTTSGGGDNPSGPTVTDVSVYKNDTATTPLNIYDLDNELDNVIFKIDYSNDTFEYEYLDKSMLALDDYNKLANAGTYTMTAYVASKTVEITLKVEKRNVKLDAPVITINNGVVSWDEINHATSYTIYLNNDHLDLTTNSYTFDENTPGDYSSYSVYVVAKSSKEGFLDSDPSNYETYNVPVLATPSIRLNPTTILVQTGAAALTWQGIDHATTFEIYLNDEKTIYTATGGSTITHTQVLTNLAAGTYNVKIRAIGTGYEPSEFSNVEVLTVEAQKYTVRFLSNGTVLKTEAVEDGQAATSPNNPAKFIGTDSMVSEFTGWDKGFDNITSDLDVNAEFKKYNAVDVSVVLKDSTSADVFVTKDDLVSTYNVRVVDEDGRLWVITQAIGKMSITGLTANGKHIINGDFTYTGGTGTIKTQHFETVGITELNDIEYFVDENTISNTSISVDLGEYREKAPEGYVLKAVYLLNADDDTLVAEHEVTDDESVVYFDDLTPDTEYKTSFMYDKATSGGSANQKHHNSPYPYRVTEGYAFYFVGFLIRTTNSNLPQRCVRIIYNDPVRGEKLLYRYYVSEGSSVSYTDWMYHNPFSFTLPIIYNDYYAVGDYRELENITEDKKVEVMLLPKRDVDAATHTIVFMDSKTNYMLGVETVANHGTVTEPAHSNDSVPEDTTVMHYEFAWDVAWHYGLYYLMIDLDDVTSSCVVMTSYKSFEKYVEPELVLDNSIVYIGKSFVRTNINFNSYKAMIPYSADSEKITIYQYLTEGSFETYVADYPTEHIEPVSAGENSRYNGYLFTGLSTGKYTLHIAVRYNINDGTGDHIKIFRTTFPVLNSSHKFVNLTLNSPNYQTITYEFTSDDSDIRIIRTPDSDEKDEYFETSVSNLYSSKKNEINYLNTNTTYRFYTAKIYKSLIVNVQKDSETTATILTHEFRKCDISADYDTCTTMDGVEPTGLTLKVKASKSTSGGHVTYHYVGYSGSKDDRIQLYVANYDTQIDIGPIRMEYSISSSEFDPYGNPYGGYRSIEFRFDADLGYYVPESGWNTYQDLFEQQYQTTDPETHQQYSYYVVVHYMHVNYFYNNYIGGNVYNKLLMDYEDSTSKIKMEIIVV